ncbi:P-loop NTPase fold protein [Campylobacter concisus]|jgi:KAP family P-loop domain|uniref:P-loop NTPase fold protein n=1 Tax=Campylobacter concisus TaxID=199 RepID=UPI0011E7B040|nr:P-loop NTPase fold protein [Campylobacter concisus]
MNNSKVDIEERLEEILERKVGTCIVLDGEWGVGKTTFWKKIFRCKIQGKFCLCIFIWQGKHPGN